MVQGTSGELPMSYFLWSGTPERLWTSICPIGEPLVPLMVKDHRVRKDRLLEKFRHGLFVFSYQAGIHPIPLGFDVVDGEDADTMRPGPASKSAKSSSAVSSPL